MNGRSTFPRWRRKFVMTLAAIAVHGSAVAADIDIYAGTGTGAAPNVLFFLDNTSNWSSQNQAWTPGSSWLKCVGFEEKRRQECAAAIQQVFYVDKGDTEPRPWGPSYTGLNPAFTDWNANASPVQGLVQVRALKLVLKALVCDAAKPLTVNVGLSLFSDDKGSVRSNGDATAFIYHHVQRLTGPASTAGTTCKALLDKLDAIDARINSPKYKAPADADYSAAFYEAFKYFGGYTNPTLATGAVSTEGQPPGREGYGPKRFSLLKTNDDHAAFTDAPSPRLTYRSPITGEGACGNNYFVLISNGYPNQEANKGPTRFEGLNYTYPRLDPASEDVKRLADEWSYFLANTDVSPVDGMQRVFTYAVNVYNKSKDADQTRLLSSIARVGGVTGSAYIEVGGDLYGLVKAFEEMLLEMASVDSVFTATTLPVSTTTQGNYLNQVFVGMFRPDPKFGPRWVGNVKQYQLGFTNQTLDLLDADGRSAIGPNGFFSPLARSFWTVDDQFFANRPPASDAPDGPTVEKGGVAQWLRRNLTDGTKRNVYTLPLSPSPMSSLSSYPFTTSNVQLSTDSATNAAMVDWVRGEANVPAGQPGAEDFVGTSWKDGTELGPDGPRHSIHGDVLHSRPLAINYGDDGIVVFYGANDGMFRAIDGRKEATKTTGGNELWAFVAPEFYDMLKRQRGGAPLLHLPETGADGKPRLPLLDAKPKDHGFDGPIGSFVLYNAGGTSVKEAIIYPSMRRGGKTVYAFDVTTKTAPKFLWKISPADSDFKLLGQTWSMAKPIVYPSASDEPPVVIVMGGGYDEAEDGNQSSTTGNRIYFIDGRKGTLLKEVATTYSVPADVTVVDTNNDGIPDRAYAVDVRGNVYRIDLPAYSKDEPAKILDKATWDNNTTAAKIAALGGKAYFAPDVVITRKFVAVMVGTGDREKPLVNSKIAGTELGPQCVNVTVVGGVEVKTQVPCDGFFMIKDTKSGDLPPSVPFTPANLALIARVDKDTMLAVPEKAVDPKLVQNGCYMTLAFNGEKVVNASTTIGGVAYFGTNRPTPTGALKCTADLGEAYAYKFPLFCNAPSSTKLVTGGMPPSPVAGTVLINVNGKDEKFNFIFGSGERGSPFTPSEPKPAVPPTRQRKFWYIDNSNR